MAKVILTEGISDAALLSRLFVTVKNYSRIHEDRGSISAFPKSEKGEWRETLQSPSPSSETLLIFACGSCGNFFSCYKSYFEYNASQGKISRLAILRDSDANLPSKTAADLNHAFQGSIAFELRQWKKCEVKSPDYPGISSEIETYLMIIPASQQGILEDSLVSIIEQGNAEQKQLVKETRSFLGNIRNQGKFLQKNRLLKKSTLGTLLSIMDPDRSIHTIESVYSQIRWEKFTKLKSIFDDLLNI